MPKKKHHKNSGNDFTIKDFADSNFTSFRPKKSNDKITQSVMLLPNHEDKNWDDSEDELEDVLRDNNETVVSKKTTAGSKDSPGVVYPLALWFLISEYILPEDVGRFAAICKATHYTTTFAKFWNDLYKKHCKPLSWLLPEHLRPDCVNRRHGLRSLVIRSLFIAYPPLAARPPSNQVCTPEHLLKCRCASVWFVSDPIKNRWWLYFKMLKWNYPVRKPTKNLMDLLDDVHANSQAGYRVLEISCTNFTECVTAMGLILTVIKASVGMNMSSHRLTLGFSTAVHAAPSVTVILDNVVRTQVYDWWHPQYPHPGENLPTSSAACPNRFNTSLDALDN